MSAQGKYWHIRLVIVSFLSVTLFVAILAFSSQPRESGSIELVQPRDTSPRRTTLSTVTAHETARLTVQGESVAKGELGTLTEGKSRETVVGESQGSALDARGGLDWTLYVIVANFTPPPNMTQAFSVVELKEGRIRGRLVVVPSVDLKEQQSGRSVLHVRIFGNGIELTVPEDRLSGSTVYRSGDKLRILRTIDLNLDFVELFIDFDLPTTMPLQVPFSLELAYGREDGSRGAASFLVFNSVEEAKKGNGLFVRNHVWKMDEVQA